MKTICKFVVSVILVWMPAVCSADKIVDNPLIESANTMSLDIARVELTDTATVLHVNAFYIPHFWIRIDSGTYLSAGGEKYALTGSRGITPDSLFWMPESGRASFVLSFRPLPGQTRSFDFIESDCEDCFKLFGIDLTGRKTYDMPGNIPAGAMETDENAPVPAPVFKSGETTVEVRFLYHREELGKTMNIYVNTLTGMQEEYTADIDPETQKAIFRFRQYGPAEVLLPMAGSVWTAPGEHATVWVDQRFSGWRIVARRNRAEAPDFRILYAEGVYASLNNLIYSRTDWPLWSMDLYDGEFAGYEMSSEEYAAHVVGTYTSLSDSITAAALPPLMKEWMQLSLKEEAVVAMLGGNFFREHNYRSVHNDWDRRNVVKGIEPMKVEDQTKICKLFDVNDPQLLMGRHASDYISYVAYSDTAWVEAAGIRDGMIPALRKFVRLASKARNATLADADLNVFGPEDDPFYPTSLKDMRKVAWNKLEAVKDKAVIEQTPDVPLDRLFDAIITPYKGKVVFVDFWNTWCGPCRMSIKATEPLKEKELKSDSIVWLYIANETSPLVQYKTMIPGIRGKHFRLNNKQWAYLCDKFQIDGIPSYVLVDKDGTYRLRNDLRDHDLLVKTLAEKISQ